MRGVDRIVANSGDETGTPVWLVQRTVLDARGRAIFSSDQFVMSNSSQPTDPSPLVYGTESIFDDRGRSVGSRRVKDAVVSISASGTGLATVYTAVRSGGTTVLSSMTEYDSQGRAYKQIGPDGQVSITEFDSRGRTIATLGMHVQATSVGLTAIGASNYVRIRSETVYNSLGQAYQSVSNIIEYGTVSNGVFTKTSTDISNKRVTEQFYDEQNRVVKVKYPDETYTIKAKSLKICCLCERGKIDRIDKPD